MTTEKAIETIRAFIERHGLKRNSGEASSNEDDFKDVQLEALDFVEKRIEGMERKASFAIEKAREASEAIDAVEYVLTC